MAARRRGHRVRLHLCRRQGALCRQPTGATDHGAPVRVRTGGQHVNLHCHIPLQTALLPVPPLPVAPRRAVNHGMRVMESQFPPSGAVAPAAADRAMVKGRAAHAGTPAAGAALPTGTIASTSHTSRRPGRSVATGTAVGRTGACIASPRRRHSRHPPCGVHLNHGGRDHDVCVPCLAPAPVRPPPRRRRPRRPLPPAPPRRHPSRRSRPCAHSSGRVAAPSPNSQPAWHSGVADPAQMVGVVSCATAHGPRRAACARACTVRDLKNQSKRNCGARRIS